MALSEQMKVLARIDRDLDKLDTAGLRYVADRTAQRIEQAGAKKAN